MTKNLIGYYVYIEGKYAHKIVSVEKYSKNSIGVTLKGCDGQGEVEWPLSDVLRMQRFEKRWD